MTETAGKTSRSLPNRSKIYSAESSMIPIMPFAPPHLLGGACLVAGLEQFPAATLISRQAQQSLYNIFEHPAGHTVSEQDARSDVLEVSPRQPLTKKRLSSEQVKLLESSFDLDSKLEPERKNQLANDLGLQPRQVAVWYQNKRARSKTKHLEHKYDVLKLQFQAVVEEKQQLEAEVLKLRELLGMQAENLSSSPLGTIAAEKEDAAVVTSLSETAATVESELPLTTEMQQQVIQVDEEEEGTAVETETESVDLSSSGTPCSGTGLSEALDPNSPLSNICDLSHNTSGSTENMPHNGQPNMCTDQMLFFNQQQQHILHQLYQHNWNRYPQPGSVKLEYDESAYLMKSHVAGEQIHCNPRENLFLLLDETDSLDFEFVT